MSESIKVLLRQRAIEAGWPKSDLYMNARARILQLEQGLEDLLEIVPDEATAKTIKDILKEKEPPKEVKLPAIGDGVFVQRSGIYQIVRFEQDGDGGIANTFAVLSNNEYKEENSVYVKDMKSVEGYETYIWEVN